MIVEVARKAIKDIGYEQEGFHWKTANVEVLLHAQSPHIAQGVDASGNKDEGAGDQGIMFGYACRETPALMPAPLFYSHKILKLLADARQAGKEPKLGPDAKSQVTVHYENGKPVGATQIVLSTQHLDADMTSNDVASCRRALYPPGSARRLDQRKDHLARQSDGRLRGRRAGWRLRSHRPQDHRRHLWRRCSAWRRRVLRQRSDEGGPLGRLCRALSRQERGRGGICRSLHHPDRLCDRRFRSAVGLCRHPRHRKGRGSQA